MNYSKIYYVMLVDYRTGSTICKKNPKRKMYNERFNLTRKGSADLLPRFVSLDFGWDVGYGFVEKTPLAGLTYVPAKAVEGEDDIFFNDFLYCSYTEKYPTKDNCDFFIKGKAILDGLRKFDRNKMFNVNDTYKRVKAKIKETKKKNRFTCSYAHDRVFGFPESYRKHNGSNEDLRIRYELNQEKAGYMEDVYSRYYYGYYRNTSSSMHDDMETIIEYFKNTIVR